MGVPGTGEVKYLDLLLSLTATLIQRAVVVGSPIDSNSDYAAEDESAELKPLSDLLGRFDPSTIVAAAE